MLEQKPTPAQAVPPDDPEPEPTMSVAEAAARLGWTEERVRLALRSDTLRGVKPGGLEGSHWAVFRWSVDALLGGGPGLIPADLAQKFRRWSRLRSELIALESEAVLLGQEIEDDLRAASPCRDGVAR
jgi:hypothetical protein